MAVEVAIGIEQAASAGPYSSNVIVPVGASPPLSVTASAIVVPRIAVGAAWPPSEGVVRAASCAAVCAVASLSAESGSSVAAATDALELSVPGASTATRTATVASPPAGIVPSAQVTTCAA